MAVPGRERCNDKGQKLITGPSNALSLNRILSHLYAESTRHFSSPQTRNATGNYEYDDTVTDIYQVLQFCHWPASIACLWPKTKARHSFRIVDTVVHLRISWKSRNFRELCAGKLITFASAHIDSSDDSIDSIRSIDSMTKSTLFIQRFFSFFVFKRIISYSFYLNKFSIQNAILNNKQCLPTDKHKYILASIQQA